MNNKSIFIPTINEESWKELLADPQKHWKNGYSAKSVALSWEKENAIPSELRSALLKEQLFSDIELLVAFPEFKVNLPGGKRPSQNDVFFLAGNNNGLISCTVEAKALEDFDKSIEKWYKDFSEGKKTRLEFLLKAINFPERQNHMLLKYQLFHRLASAIILARKFHAKYALMVVQSFVEDDNKNHYDDFKSFIECYNILSEKEKPLKLTEVDGIIVFALWVYSKPLG